MTIKLINIVQVCINVTCPANLGLPIAKKFVIVSCMGGMTVDAAVTRAAGQVIIRREKSVLNILVALQTLLSINFTVTMTV